MSSGELRQCDLVMKGGITSGVVYTKAIQRIARDYRLRSIGGASAGAIAAVAAAACEYQRQGDPAAGVEPNPNAFAQLDAVTAQVKSDGFVEGLFQPTPAGKPALDVALGAVTGTGSVPRRAIGAARSIFARDVTVRLLWWLVFVLWLAFAVAAGYGLFAHGVSWLDGAALAGLVFFTILALGSMLVLAILGALVRFAFAANAALEGSFLGFVTGHVDQAGGRPALTDWLHQTIQTCAGLPSDRPLTFDMLRGQDPHDPTVDLRLITTDLSYSRPVDLPPDTSSAGGDPQYYFDPDQLARLFPADVVNAMKGGEPFVDGGRTYYPLPGGALPIVVAARLSLSFPMLLATVPLWSKHPVSGNLVEHCMSDGGISSNFPIHFFDSLFPSRPTFGLDLQPYPTERARGGADEPYVVMGGKRTPGYSGVHTVLEFFPQLLDAALNWRDNMQSELPGYRDRICQIRLTTTEGGLNLNMPEPVIDQLIQRGADAGEAVCTEFSWPRHGFTRFLTLMQMLQVGLGRAGKRLAAFRTEVATGTIPEEAWEWASGHEPPWWAESSRRAGDLLDQVTWGPDAPPDFDDASAPGPTPVMRIVPRV